MSHKPSRGRYTLHSSPNLGCWKDQEGRVSKELRWGREVTQCSTPPWSPIAKAHMMGSGDREQLGLHNAGADILEE